MPLAVRAHRCTHGEGFGATSKLIIIAALCILAVNSQDVPPEAITSGDPSEATDATDKETSVPSTEANPDLFENLEHKIIRGVDLDIRWEFPEEFQGLYSYVAVCEDPDTGHRVSKTVDSGTFPAHVVLSLEKPFTTFECTLLAVGTETGKAVNGDPIKFTASTGEIAPPSNVTLSGFTSTSLTYKWNTDTTPSKWRVVTTEIGQLDGDGTGTEEYGEGKYRTAEHSVQNLQPATQYNISIQNCRGIFCSRPTFVTGVTDAAPPGPVRNLSYKLINGTVLELTWDAPEGTKEVDGYFVTCQSTSFCLDVSKQIESVGTSSPVLLHLEEPKETFECAVQAFRTDAAGHHLNGTVTKFETSTEGLYAPEKLRLLDRTDHSLYLAWTPDLNTTVWNMVVWRVLPSGTEHDSIQEQGESAGKNMKYNLTNLTPWTRYNISIQNCHENFCSEQAILVASTATAAPSRVKNFAYGIEKDVNAHITWEPPEQPNGPIDGYQLLVYNEDRQEESSFTVPGNVTQITLNLTLEFNLFNASIRAYNFEESSNETMYSPASRVIFHTLGNGPMPPRVDVTDVTDSSARLSWEQPSDPRYKIVQFIVNVNGSHTISTTDCHLVMGDLDAWKRYSVSIASCISDTTCGQEATVTFDTDFGAPSVPLNLTISSMGSHWMFVEWEKPKVSNGPLSGYNVSISDGTTVFHVTTTDPFYNYTEVVPDTAYDVTVNGFSDVDGRQKHGAVASVKTSSLDTDTLNMAGLSTTRVLIGVLSGVVLVLLIAAYLLHKKCPLTRGTGKKKHADDIRKPTRLLLDDL